ncbi:uncharacterized protein LOC130690773 [Daphnia carinata]|uniref:uncharacterized protein LOC130690773 n=1 Tax=Daphnia carinata TaxID=120202 RepID=UPI00257F9E88|nr:uncharacterized protein LOC130690773 [Daphnia carinata]
MTFPPPLIPIHGYNHIHHDVVNPFMSNRQSESQVGTSYDRQPYNVQEITLIGVRDQQYDKQSSAQNEDFAKQIEPEFNPLQRSTQEDAEFSPTLLCHHFHLPQDNGYQEKRGNTKTAEKLKSVEDIRDVQVAATQSNAVEWKKQKENPRQFFQCKTCVKKYTTKKGLQRHVESKHDKNQTDCQFTNTMTPRPNVQRKQIDNDHHDRYLENGLVVLPHQTSLFLLQDYPFPPVKIQ